MRQIIFTLSVIISLPIWANELQIRPFIDKLLHPMVKCPERIWPSYRPLEKGYFVLSYPSQNSAYVINQDKSVRKDTFSDWKDSGTSPFDMTSRNGIKVVVINMEDSDVEGSLIDLLFHEGFHHFNQEEMGTQMKRDEVFPVDYDARVGRAMQIKYLKESFSGQNELSLKKAAFWENWIKLNREEDYIHNQQWDYFEGSADFVGVYSRAIAELGCEASDEELEKHVLNDTHLSLISGRSSQSYYAGQLGYLLAKKLKRDEIFLNKKSPVTQILKDISPVDDDFDNDIRNQFTKLYGLINLKVEEARNYFNNSTDLVAVPMLSIQGAFTAMGFYKTQNGAQELKLLINSSLTFSDQKGSMILKNKDIVPYEPKLCGEFYHYLIPVSDIQNLTTEPGILSNTFGFEEQGTLYGKRLWCTK